MIKSRAVFRQKNVHHKKLLYFVQAKKYTGNLIDNYCPEFECSPDGCCEEISCFCNNGLPEVGRNCPNPGDYKCKACFENYWLSGIECIQARTCVPGLQYELIPPAEESDRICASLKSCNSLQYESQAPTSIQIEYVQI